MWRLAGASIVYLYTVRDPLDTGNRPKRHPAIILLWAVGIALLLIAILIFAKGEQVRSELKQSDQSQAATSNDFDS